MPTQNPAFTQSARFRHHLAALFSLLIAICLLGWAQAQSVSISWTANAEPDISGYTIQLGTASGVYSATYDAGNTQRMALPQLSPSTTYYCTVQAYNSYGLTSEPSQEIAFTTSAVASAEISIATQAGAELSNGTANITLGSAVIGSAGPAQTITITNQGTAALTNLGVSLGGAHPSDFSVSNLSSSTLAAGASLSLDIIFSPISSGTRAATLSITSNDSDESPFAINLSGTGAVIATPEISVTKSDGTELMDGASSIAFGSVNLGASGATQILTILNSGSAALSGLAVTVDGAAAADFILTQLSSTSVGTGSATTFGITFKPTSAGSRSAALHIASNDADESPFDISLTGTGISSPEIEVTKADGTNLIDGVSSVSFGSIYLGSSSSVFSFTVRNTGSASLSGLALTIDGAGAADYLVSSIGSTTVGAGAGTTFSVTFKPTVAGSRPAVIHLASNDADENPFDITLTGNGVSVPEISITKADGTELADGVSSLAFGAVQLGAASASQSIVIRSIGSGALSGLTVSIDGPGAADFSVSPLPSGTLNAGSTASLGIVFAPKTAGLRSAVIHITSNDADESPFDINLGGTGFGLPRLEVFDEDGNPISSGTPASFGTINLGESSATKEITILSTGTADLTGIASSISGPHASDFKIASFRGSTLSPGAGASLRITFIPTQSGARAATLAIASNDPNSPSFLIPLQGSAAAHPEITIFNRAGNELTHNAPTLQFGSADLGETGTELTFSVTNRGNADLTNLAITTTGSHSADFVTTAPTSTLLKPGESSSFSVRFQPSSSGSREAFLQISSNDSNRGTISIPLAGTGVGQPQLEVLLDGQTLSGSRIAPIDFGSTPSGETGKWRTFTLRNTGTASLGGIKVIRGGGAQSDFQIELPKATSLKPGASTSFKVRFEAGAKGRRETMITISGQDESITTVSIPLFAISVATPSLEMKVAGGGSLSATRAYISFPDGAAKNLILTNRGNAPLTNLRISASGIHVRDFELSNLKNNSLAPGRSVSIRIRFEGSGKGTRWAALKVSSNDPDTPMFEISLVGKSASSAKSARIPKPGTDHLTTASEPSRPVVSTLIIDGQKYRCITIPKFKGRMLDPKFVEVSSDRVDWNSGRRFTTVVDENERFLKVRDKTPVAPDSKRHIRYRPRN